MALNLEKLVTRAQIAEAFGVSTKTVTRWVAAGKFPPPIHVLGGSRWREKDVTDYVARRETIARRGFAVR